MTFREDRGSASSPTIVGILHYDTFHVMYICHGGCINGKMLYNVVQTPQNLNQNQMWVWTQWQTLTTISLFNMDYVIHLPSIIYNDLALSRKWKKMDIQLKMILVCLRFWHWTLNLKIWHLTSHYEIFTLGISNLDTENLKILTPGIDLLQILMQDIYPPPPKRIPSLRLRWKWLKLCVCSAQNMSVLLYYFRCIYICKLSVWVTVISNSASSWCFFYFSWYCGHMQVNYSHIELSIQIKQLNFYRNLFRNSLGQLPNVAIT